MNRPSQDQAVLARELEAIDRRLRSVPTQVECSHAVNDLLRFMDKHAPALLTALQSPKGQSEGGEVERKADDWLATAFPPEHPNDRVFGADEMIDAFMAGHDAAQTAGETIPLREGFQERVGEWMQQCFTPEIIADKLERSDRFIEESLELVQACGYSADRAHALVDYVFGRPVGEASQEVGGVKVTLAALCNSHGLNADECGETELTRILAPEVILKIRAKQASKPVGSALPSPVALSTGADDTAEATPDDR